MRRTRAPWLTLVLLAAASQPYAGEFRRLPLREYRDRMKAGWIGQMVGVGWGTVIATRCGQDSDCNPSNAAGVLCTTIGFRRLPGKFAAALNEKLVFSHTAYSFPRLVAVCETLARQCVARAGGRIEKDTNSEETLVIPVQSPRPSRLEQCWEPGPVANSRFTKEEMASITAPKPLPGGAIDLSGAVKKFAPGWKATNCGPDMNPGLRSSWGGRDNVLVTHPLRRGVGCTLSRQVALPAGKRATLRLAVAHDPRGDWVLIVKADGAELLRKEVCKRTAPGGWLDVDVDLTACSGRTVKIELVNHPDEWAWEAGYWARITIKSE